MDSKKETNHQASSNKNNSIISSNTISSFPDESQELIDQKLAEASVIFKNTSEGIIITDRNSIILRVNPGFCHITGYSADEVIGKNASLLKSDRHEPDFYTDIFTSLENDGNWNGEIWSRRKNGEIYPELLSIYLIGDFNNPQCRYLALFNDISHLITKNNQVYNHAYYDTLTGLPNRLLLHDRLKFMINQAKRNEHSIAILIIDVNRFKIINDTLGYSAGDSLLQTIATRLKSCLRDDDSVFRSGDDDFAIILDDINDTESSAKVASRILAACSLPFALSERELYVTLSIGISTYPNDSEDHESLLKFAEDAMLRSKELGINNYQHYKPAMHCSDFEQLNLEHNLRKAIDEEEFTVYYQPQVDMKTMEITGAEALVRWIHPELGMISPAQFIPIAEETGLILPLGEWVLRTACTQMKKWKDKFNKELVISVNLSARQFHQQDVTASVSQVLLDTDLPPSWLELEITESLGMKNPELTLRTLHELKQMGILISIDDFGTGYSSLSYLKKFPIDTLKVDRSFVSDIQTDPTDASIVQVIITLAHTMKLKVIAEGVELQEQLDFLALNGCEQMQGYIFSPPVPAETFEKILSDNIEKVNNPTKE